MSVEFFTTKSGNRIDYFDSKQGEGLLIYHHGTPAAGPLDDFMINTAAKNNLRIVELVRPGYGNSTRVKDRTVAEIADTANELAFLARCTGSPRMSVSFNSGFFKRVSTATAFLAF